MESPAAAAPFRILERNDLFHLGENPENIPWQPFHKGVDIHRLYGDGVTGPTAALIRFREEAAVPRHVHQGYEHILVLAGSQRDEYGSIHSGDLRIHAPGTPHQAVGMPGCIVLAIYEKPVKFLGEEEEINFPPLKET